MKGRNKLLVKKDSSRIFISDGGDNFQIFKFWQEKDGSIYCCWPYFNDSEWLTPGIDSSGETRLVKFNSVGDGKLSIHKDGMCAFRSHENEKNRPLIIKGNNLINDEKQECGVRHLFTIFPKEPAYFPNSPLFNRKTDYLINAKEINPYFLIFFAIPKTPQKLMFDFQIEFKVDDMNIPPEGGGGNIELKFHNVFWFSYRTKHMEDWPKKNQVIFHDGFTLPIFIAIGENKLRLELRKPKYFLKGDRLIIEA